MKTVLRCLRYAAVIGAAVVASAFAYRRITEFSRHERPHFAAASKARQQAAVFASDGTGIIIGLG